MDWIDHLRGHVVSLETELVELRHHLHEHPEVSHEEAATAATVADALRLSGLEPRTGVAGHGVVADLRLGDGPRIVAMRTDMDALPIQDCKPASVAHRSRRAGVMHACGHDLHTTIGVGVARALARAGVRAPGTVRLIFQPAEEATPGGANGMAAAGVMKDVSAIVAVHSDPTLPPGRIGLRRGPATAATDQFTIEVIGRGGHSSRPHQAIDAIAVASAILSGVYQLRGTRIDPRRAAVLNVGRIRGGEAPNALADRCVLEGCIRTADPESRGALADALRTLARTCAEAAGARVELRIANGAPPLCNDPVLAGIVEKAALAVLGPGSVEELPEPSMGGEDFAVYGEHAPAMLVRVGTAPPGDYVPLHSNVFDVDDRAIVPAVTLMCAVMLDLLARDHPAASEAKARPGS